MSIATLAIFTLVAFSNHANSAQVRLIRHAAFVPLFTSNFTFAHNLSEEECLCRAVPDYTVVNYFNNRTCQLFGKIPCAYRVRLQVQTRLYSLDASVTLTGGSCTLNLYQLVEKLNNTVPTNINVLTPRCLVMDDQKGYLVTVRTNPPFLERYDPENLTLIDQMSLSGLYPLTLAFHAGAYYAGTYFDSILIINSTTLTIINTITSLYLSGPRDMIFINNGYTMIVASANNNFLIFFNRSELASTAYTFVYRVSFSRQQPHGLWRINDSFFFVTSYINNTIYSYSAENNGSWTEALVVDASSIISTGGGTHVTVDPDGRLWFSMENGGALIYDKQAVLLGTFSYPSVSIYDIFITENYVVYLSSYLSNQLLRFDPQINH